MKLPKRPPDEAELLKRLPDSARLLEILQSVDGPLAAGKYLHWDRLQYYPPPEGLTHPEWWLGLKARRRGRRIPLVDLHGTPFQFNLIEPLQKILYEIDNYRGGTIANLEQISEPETRDSYLIRSLIEEAFTSSQLEGAASTREIAKELVRKERQPRNHRERMILNNYHAMRRILDLKGEPLSRELVLEIHRIITEEALQDASAAGRFRRDDERIVVGDDADVVFHAPPPARELEGRLEAMCAFANDSNESTFVHPALKAMTLHFWLAYDHPFVDGNGRTARALFYWSMLNQGYWLFEFVSISQTILKAPVQYGEAFLETETDSNDLTYFLLYHARVIQRAVQELKTYLEQRTQEFRYLETDLRGLARLNFRQKELIRHALRRPRTSFTVESHRLSHDVSPQTARNDLQQLEVQGLLERKRIGRTDHFFASRDLKRRLRK